MCVQCKYAWVRLPAYILHGQWMKRERGMFACVCVCVCLCVFVCVYVCICERCMSVCVQGRWIVSHHLWLIKRRQSKRLILTHCLMAKTRRWTHNPKTQRHTQTFSVTLIRFLFKLSLYFCPSTSLILSWTYSYTQFAHVHTHTLSHTQAQWTGTVLTPPYVGAVADAKTRGTSRYQQSTACLIPLTHHHLTDLIIYHTRIIQ